MSHVGHQEPEPAATPIREATRPSRQVTRLAVVFELGLALLAAAGSWVFGYQLLAAVRPTLTGTIVGALATVPLLGGLSLAVRSDWPAMRRLRAEVERHVLPLFEHCSLLQLAAIAAAAGIGEELFFRGLVQGVLTNVLGPWSALLLASALFGIAHLITRTYALLAALVGFYLGGLTLLMSGLWTPIVVHSLYDFIALMILTRSGQQPDPGRVLRVPEPEDQVPPTPLAGSGGNAMRSTTASNPENPRSAS